MKPHIVIIGGGFGGLDAARGFAGAPLRVTLLDRHNYHLFQPLLYQVATASLSPGDIASPIRWVLRRQENVQVLLAEARAIDTTAHRVVIDPGPEAARHNEITYDYLIVATGATHAYFGHPEWAIRAPGLKTLDPGARKRLMTFVIVGGGPTGVELAGALAEIARQSLKEDFRSIRPESAQIILVEGGPHLLPAFPASLREAAQASLARLGVDVKIGSVVVGVDEQGVVCRSANASDHRIEAQTVLWAAGVAASPLVTSIGVPLDRAGRVLVDPTLVVPGHPDVFVIGDVCALQQDGKWLPGVAQVAKQQGAHAARNILRSIRGEQLTPFRYHDYGSMATIGRGSAVADFGRIKASGFVAWLMWLFTHIFWLIGFRNRVFVFTEWAWAYVTMQRRVRLITGERLWPGSD